MTFDTENEWLSLRYFWCKIKHININYLCHLYYSRVWRRHTTLRYNKGRNLPTNLLFEKIKNLVWPFFWEFHPLHNFSQLRKTRSLYPSLGYAKISIKLCRFLYYFSRDILSASLHIARCHNPHPIHGWISGSILKTAE